MNRFARINRIMTIAILPMMAIVIVMAARSVQSSREKVAMPRSGLLVVANLRGEDLTLIDLGAATSRTLELPGPPHEMGVAGQRLYITLGRANLLVEVDPRGPGILRTLALEGEPHGLAIDGDRLLVTLDKGDALVTVDRTSLTELAREPTGQTPHAVAIEGGVAYVAESRANRLHAFPPGMTAETGSMPESVAASDRYVATADVESGTVSVFSRDGLQPAGRISVGGAPVRLQWLPGGLAAVSLNADARVAVVDPGKGRLLRKVTVGGHPDGLCVSPGNDYLAVPSNETGAVAFLHLREWVVAGSLPAGDGPGSCAWLPAR